LIWGLFDFTGGITTHFTT